MRDFLVYIVGHSIANVRNLHNHWHDIRCRDVTFRVFVYCFSTPGATLDSYLSSPAYNDLCKAPRPDLTIIFMGGNDISQETVVAELPYKLTKFCKHIEEITNSFAKVFMIESCNRLRGVDTDTYNKIRNSLNRNLQHRAREYFPDHVVITPLRFEYLSSDGIHPGPTGIARLVYKIRKVVGSYLYAYHAHEVRR